MADLGSFTPPPGRHVSLTGATPCHRCRRPLREHTPACPAVPLGGAAYDESVIDEAREAQALDPEFEEWLADRDGPPRVVKVTDLRAHYHYVQGLDLERPTAYLLIHVVQSGDGTTFVATRSGVSRTYADSDRVWTMDPAEVSDAQDAAHDAQMAALEADPDDPRDYL